MHDNQDRTITCSDRNHYGNRENYSHCEINEQTIAATGNVNVDAGTNGGISVKGWNRNERSRQEV